MDRRGRPVSYKLGTRNGTIVHLILLCGAVPVDVFSTIYSETTAQKKYWQRRIRALIKRGVITYMVFADTTIRGITFSSPDIPEEILERDELDRGYVEYYKEFGKYARERAVSFPTQQQQKSLSQDHYNVTKRGVKKKGKKRSTISEGLRVAKNAYAAAMFQRAYSNVYPKMLRMPLPFMPKDIRTIYASTSSYTDTMKELAISLPTFYTPYGLRTFRINEILMETMEICRENAPKNRRPKYPTDAEYKKLVKEAKKAASTKKTSSIAGIYAGGGNDEDEFYYSVYTLPQGNMKWSTTEELNFWTEVKGNMLHYGRQELPNGGITAVELYGNPNTIIKQMIGYRGKRYLNVDGYGLMEKNYAVPLSYDGLLLLQAMLTPGWEDRIHRYVLTKELYHGAVEGDTVYDAIDLEGKTYYLDFCVPDIIRLKKFLKSVPLVTNDDFSFEIDCFDYQLPILWHVIRAMRESGELNVKIVNKFQDEEYFPGIEIEDTAMGLGFGTKQIAIFDFPTSEVLFGEEPNVSKPNALLTMLDKENRLRARAEKRIQTMRNKADHNDAE